jgi:hypothetical protein
MELIGCAKSDERIVAELAVGVPLSEYSQKIGSQNNG